MEITPREDFSQVMFYIFVMHSKIYYADFTITFGCPVLPHSMILYKSVCRLQNGKLVKVVECFGPQSIHACKCYAEEALNSLPTPNNPQSLCWIGRGYFSHLPNIFILYKKMYISQIWLFFSLNSEFVTIETFIYTALFIPSYFKQLTRLSLLNLFIATFLGVSLK